MEVKTKTKKPSFSTAKKEHTYLLHYVCGHSGLVATTRPATASDLRKMEAQPCHDCRLSANAPMQVRFQKRHPDATMPTQGTPGSAGYDMTAVSMERKNDLIVYDTGIAIEIPAGYVGLVFQRSSVYKTGLMLCNAVGVIDSDYRGSISFVYRNLLGVGGRDCAHYGIGDRIGQIVFMPVPKVELVESDVLTETARGAGGYGSTGK